MQDKDSEALRNQRRRRKRIARMKHTIIAIIAGWIILSMILIIFLLVRTRSMERKLDELWQMQRVMNQQVPDTPFFFRLSNAKMMLRLIFIIGCV